MWSDIYRPTQIERMVGNENARIAVVKWLLTWVDGSRPLLIIGPPGVGKTTIVKALAHQFNYDLIEMNASDTRNKEVLMNRILPLLNNKSLFGKKMLLFLDEIDGIYGRQDAGGLESLLGLIKEPSIPIILAANSKDSKLKVLAKACKIIEFNKIRPTLLLLYLNYVLRKEGKDIDRNQKISIIRNANGDIRSLLNNVQAKLSGYSAMRDSSFQVDISKAIDYFFSSRSMEEAQQSLMNANANYSDPRFGQSSEDKRKDIMYAFFSSIISSNIDTRTMTDMLELLSKADLIVGRVTEKRHWTLLKYIDIILSHALFDKLSGKKIKYNQYSLPWPIAGPMFARAQALRNLLSYLPHEAHVSKSTFGLIYLPYMLIVLASQKIDLKEFVQDFDLDVKSAEALSKETRRLKK
ncbi:MAG TPA: AAA family ATPase [Nitrososphaeraceae archaeon]